MKKEAKSKESLILSLFGDNPPTYEVVLDEEAPKQAQVKDDKADDSNCACE